MFGFTKKGFIWILLFGIGSIYTPPSYSTSPANKDDVLYIYNWADSLPKTLIEKFEQETGIRVVCDVFDSSEMLEAKMLASSSGFDVVFPSAFPDLWRQIPAGCYLPLDDTKIPNLKKLDPLLVRRLDAVDPGHRYAVPYIWGTTGFSYNKTLVEHCLPNAPVDSWAMLFDEQVVKKLSTCGISLLDSPIEVFPAALSYLGLDPNTQNVEDLEKATHLLKKIFPYVQKLDSFQFISQLPNQEMCVAQTWSCYGNTAARRGIEMQEDVRYVIPKEGGFLWFDVMAIPKDAPHKEHAHRFINFLLEPENIAEITNKLYIANCVPSSLPLVHENIRRDPGIYPNQKIIEKLKTDSKKRKAHQSYLTRQWMKIKAGL